MLGYSWFLFQFSLAFEMQEIRIFLLLYHELAVIKFLHYRLHTKCTCTWKESIRVLLCCYVTRFVLARAAIVFHRDNTPRIWCITSEAPPVRIERETERILTLSPPSLYWSGYVRLSPWLQMIFYFSLRSFISSCKTGPFAFIVYNWVPPFGGLEQKTRSHSEAFIYPEVKWFNL